MPLSGPTSTNCTSDPPKPCAQNMADLPSNSSDPLPSQVALEDDALRAAIQLSMAECQRHQKQLNMSMEKYENELVRAVSESELKSVADEHFEESLKIACEDSLVVEQQQRDRILLSDEQYENELLLALKQSTLESNPPIKSEEDEHHILQQALAESKACFTEYQSTNHSENDLLEMAFAESLAEEERRNAYRREQERLAMSQESVLIEEVKRLSLQQQQQQQQQQRRHQEEQIPELE